MTRSKIPKILLISRSVPPGASGSSVIIGNLARQFTRDEMVVIGSWFIKSPPVEWEADWPRLHYPTINPPDGWRGLRLIRWGQFPFLLVYSWLACIFTRCEVVMGVYPNEVHLLAAYLVSVMTGKPLYLYFHNTYLESARGNIMAAWLQPRLFKRAKHTFVMSKAMQDLYRDVYPDVVCSPLLHSFNEQPPDSANLPSTDIHGNPLKLALVGSINASNEGAVEHLAAAVKNAPDVEVWMYSRTNPNYLKTLGVDGAQFHLNTVSRDELIAEIQKADILFLPHGFSDRESVEEILTVFPTRTIEYLLAGRPILAHVPDPCFIGDFLRGNQCALVVTDPDPSAILEAIDRLKADADLRKQLVQYAARTVRQFHAPVVAEHLRQTIAIRDVQLVSG